MNLLAQDFGAIQGSSGLKSPGSVGSLIGDKVLPYVFGAAGIILLLNLISAGFKMMTSGGDPKAMQSAQSKITSSLIGILILSTSFAIVELIMSFLGINIKIF